MNYAVLILVALAGIVLGLLAFYFFGRKKEEAAGGQALLLIQNQLQELARVVGQQMGE